MKQKAFGVVCPSYKMGQLCQWLYRITKVRLTRSLMLNETQMNSFLRKHDVTKFYLFAGDYPLYNQTFSVYCKTYPPPTGDRPVHIPGDKADYWSDAAAYHIQ